MKKTAEEILKETINSINESDRWVIDRKGIKYVREDIVLKAISNVSLPPVREEEIRKEANKRFYSIPQKANAFIEGGKFALSHLLHEQPVGNPGKLEIKQSEENEPLKSEPKVIERFTDNGEHSHWELIDVETGKILWDESILDK